MDKSTAFILLVLLVGISNCDRKKRGVISLLDTVDEYCEGEVTCNDDVMDDLIWYMSGEPYDDELDAGTSRTTLLLESIDDKCENDQSCVDSLLEVLKERILDDPIALP